MAPEALGTGTIKRLAELRTEGRPMLSVYLDLEAESLSAPAALDLQLTHRGRWSAGWLPASESGHAGFGADRLLRAPGWILRYRNVIALARSGVIPKPSGRRHAARYWPSRVSVRALCVASYIVISAQSRRDRVRTRRSGPTVRECPGVPGDQS